MIIACIYLIICLILEIIVILVKSRKRKTNDKATLECLNKMVEFNVLNTTLNNPINTDQALASEYRKLFLKVEFVDAKPYLGYLFDLVESITIGRDRESKIVIRDDNVSRLHCKIYIMNGQVFIQDMNSTNGTYIKGKWSRKQRLQPQSVSLMDGDKIIVGGYVMKINFLYGNQVRQ